MEKILIYKEGELKWPLPLGQERFPERAKGFK